MTNDICKNYFPKGYELKPVSARASDDTGTLQEIEDVLVVLEIIQEIEKTSNQVSALLDSLSDDEYQEFFVDNYYGKTKNEKGQSLLDKLANRLDRSLLQLDLDKGPLPESDPRFKQLSKMTDMFKSFKDKIAALKAQIASAGLSVSAIKTLKEVDGALMSLIASSEKDISLLPKAYESYLSFALVFMERNVSAKARQKASGLIVLAQIIKKKLKELKEKGTVGLPFYNSEIERIKQGLREYSRSICGSYAQKSAPAATEAPKNPSFSIPWSVGLLAGYGRELSSPEVKTDGLRTALKAEAAVATQNWMVGAHYLSQIVADVEGSQQIISGHDLLTAFGEYQTEQFNLLAQAGYEYFESDDTSEQSFDAFVFRLGGMGRLWKGLWMNGKANVRIGDEDGAFFEGKGALGLYWKEGFLIPFAEGIFGYEGSAPNYGGAIGLGLPFSEKHAAFSYVELSRAEGFLATLCFFSKFHQYFETGAKAFYSHDLSASQTLTGEVFIQVPFAKAAGEEIGIQFSFDASSSPDLGGFGAIWYGRPIVPFDVIKPYSLKPPGGIF